MLERFTWFKQSAYLWQGDGLTVYIDPWEVSDDSPPADILFLTHAHFDHFSMDDIEKIRKDSTKIYAPADVAKEIPGEVTPVTPGQSLDAGGIRVQTVPAYNTAEERLDFHPKSNNWVGYVLELGGATYYHAGDTDHLPELESIATDVSFVPIGGTYTMDHVQAAGFVKALAPKLAVPMHYAHVVGSPSDADAFAAEAAPVPVQILTPRVPFS
jgi:L-ascorbate metabolism protein UlaG (beta-lactamase superfamily)